jgi:hypothetical protein
LALTLSVSLGLVADAVAADAGIFRALALFCVNVCVIIRVRDGNLDRGPEPDAVRLVLLVDGRNELGLALGGGGRSN